jgi:hypothetical protein
LLRYAFSPPNYSTKRTPKYTSIDFTDNWSSKYQANELSDVFRAELRSNEEAKCVAIIEAKFEANDDANG